MKNNFFPTIRMWWEKIKTCWIVTAPQDVRNFMEDIRSEYRVDFGREATSEEIVAKAPNFLRWAYADDNIFHEPSFLFFLRRNGADGQTIAVARQEDCSSAHIQEEEPASVVLGTQCYYCPGREDCSLWQEAVAAAERGEKVGCTCGACAYFNM